MYHSQVANMVRRNSALNGPCGRTQRFIAIVPEIMERQRGDIIEIGAGCGESTCEFLRIARKYDRRVLVIDPWAGHDGVSDQTSNPSYAYTYEIFLKNTEEWRDVLDICRLPSEHKNVAKFMRGRSFCFGFADGLMTYDGVMSNLNLLASLNIRVICADDWPRSEPRRAIEKFSSTQGYELVIPGNSDSQQDAYLIK